MSQRDSGYARKGRDFYRTPEWVTLALLPHLPRKPAIVWECASGDGAMLEPLRTGGAHVTATDITGGCDFLATDRPIESRCDAIITNPPYEQATAFCEHALALMERPAGLVAMLLRTDFDHAKSRAHLFRDCPAFAKKLVLTKRIVWFAEDNGKPKAAPSFNHAWYIWDWRHEGAPTIAYGPN
jgi:hypothetical protein